MKASKFQHSAGFTIVEMVGYLGMFAVLSGLVVWEYSDLKKRQAHFEEVTERILGVLESGERWRNEMRQATEVRIIESKSTAIAISNEKKCIEYSFREGTLWKRNQKSNLEQPLMRRLKAASFHMDPRKGGLRRIRLEVELDGMGLSKTKPIRYTFMVPIKQS